MVRLEFKITVRQAGASFASGARILTIDGIAAL